MYSQMLKLDVISVGDANMDLMMKVPFHPKPSIDQGQPAGVRGSEYHMGPGGVGANVASAMAQLGDRVGFIGVVGDDDLGQTLRQRLMVMGIDIRYLCMIASVSTSLLCFFESDDGKHLFYSCPGARHIPPDCFAEDFIASARLFFISGNILTQEETTAQAVLNAIRKAKESKVTIALDPSKYWLNLALDHFVHEAISLTDVLLPNSNEAHILTGCSSMKDAGHALLEKGPKVVAIKMGENGSMVISKDKEIEQPAFSTNVVSNLGAGDAFNGGFLHGYLRNWPNQQALRFANATASLKIRFRGAQAGLPSRTDVEAFLMDQMDAQVND